MFVRLAYIPLQPVEWAMDVIEGGAHSPKTEPVLEGAGALGSLNELL